MNDRAEAITMRNTSLAWRDLQASSPPSTSLRGACFTLDEHTIRELGLSNSRGADALLARLDTTASLGGRSALRSFLQSPLASQEAIVARQQALRQLDEAAREAIRALSALAEPLRSYLESGYLTLPQGRLARSILLWRYPEMASAISGGLGVLARFVSLGRTVAAALRSADSADPELRSAIRELTDGLEAVRLASPALYEASAVQSGRLPHSADGPCRRGARAELAAAASAVGRLDALCALAAWSSRPGMTWPRFDSENGVSLKLERARSPLFDSSVPLNVCIPTSTRLVLVTGQNAAGKSTVLRTVAGIAHLAHVGCAVPAETAEFPELGGLASALHVSDDTRTGSSRYVAELRRLRLLRDACADAGRFLAFIDEPLLGTSLTQGHTTRRAVIEDLGRAPGGIWFIATHDLALATALGDKPEVTCLAVTPWRAVQVGSAPELLEEGVAPDTDPAEVAAREYFGQRTLER